MHHAAEPQSRNRLRTLLRCGNAEGSNWIQLSARRGAISIRREAKQAALSRASRTEGAAYVATHAPLNERRERRRANQSKVWGQVAVCPMFCEVRRTFFSIFAKQVKWSAKLNVSRREKPIAELPVFKLSFFA